jgi:hypothetical protein
MGAVKATGRLLVVLGSTAAFLALLVPSKASTTDERTNSFVSANRTLSASTPAKVVRLKARTMSGEEPAFRKAIDALDAQSGRVVRGVGLVPEAVSEETRVPVKRLEAQQAETGLSYGELLVANSLAVGSGNSFARILAMRAKTLTWADLSWKLRINPNSIVARAHGAVDIINDTQGRYNRQRKETIYGLDMRRMQNSQNVPRSFFRGKPGG